ncbi:MAG: hypothetical protein ACAH83_18600 [Alphaproteobacteria bacterium]
MSTVSYIRHLLFGDEPLTVEISRDKCREGSVFIPVESRYRGYRVQIKKSAVAITRRNMWRLFVGMPSLYHFAGTVREIDHNNVALKVSGVITMRPFFRFFFSLWFALILLSLSVFCIRAVLLAGSFMHSPKSVDITDLAGVGIMIGIGIMVLVFGALILKLLTFLDRAERQRLIQFCAEEFGQFRGQNT